MKYTIILTILIALMAIYLVFGQNGLMKYREMTNIRQSYEVQIMEMDKKIEELEMELELAKKDKEFLENMIRRDLGMQKNGEDLYIIENNKEKSIENE